MSEQDLLTKLSEAIKLCNESEAHIQEARKLTKKATSITLDAAHLYTEQRRESLKEAANE